MAGAGGVGGSAGAAGAAGRAGGDARPGGADRPGARDTGRDHGGADADDDIGGEPVPGKPWIRLCPKSDSQAQCCELLCRCLKSRCSDVPMDNARIPGCMSMCMGLTDYRARCQVFHCFESKNPGFVRDHASHCGHASGRVGGGSCRAIDEQQ
jgi:hypothetical protein